MKKVLHALFFICGLCGCKSVITVQGDVKNLPGNMVYLLKGNSTLDSAVVINNRFTFTKKVNKKYAPQLVRFQAQNPYGYYESPFYLYDDKHPLDSLHSIRNLVYLESGKTVISGDYKNRYLVFQSGKNNDLHFHDQSPSGFISWSNNTEFASRKIDLEKAKLFIMNNPTSFFFLDKIIAYKMNFTADELLQMFELFDKKVQRTQKAKELQAYADFKKGDSLVYSQFKLLDTSNKFVNILDSNASVTILSFWASWCMPCRSEIPILKKIFEKYHDSGVTIISISTEKSEQDWKKALEDLQMPWSQYKIPEEEHEKWIRRFDAYVIPETLFLSKDGKVIEKIFGFDSEKIEKKYDSILHKLVQKN